MPVAEAELGELVQQGDVGAFSTLYETYARSVHDYLLRLVRDPAAAEDLTQATFIKAFEQRAAIRDPSKIRGWLWSAAHNQAMNHLSRTRKSVAIDDQLDLATMARGPEEVAEAKDAAELVWLAAASLEPRQYAVLDLTVRRDLSTQEVAEALGVPVTHAAVLVNRAREALGNAVRYLLVARRRERCPQLAALVPAGVRSLTPEQRSTVDHHMRRCERCRELGDRLTAPAELLGTFVLLPLPAQLRKVDWSKTLHVTSHVPGGRAGRRTARSASHQAATAVQVMVSIFAITALGLPESGSASEPASPAVLSQAQAPGHGVVAASSRPTASPGSAGTTSGSPATGSSEGLIAVTDASAFGGDLTHLVYSTHPVTVQLFRADGTRANTLTLRSGVAIIGAAGPRLFILEPGGVLRGVKIDGSSTEELGNLGTKELFGFVPSPDGQRWLWGTLDSGVAYGPEPTLGSGIPQPGAPPSPTLESSIHLAGVGLPERIVDRASYVGRVIQPSGWTVAGPVVGIRQVCCGLGGGPVAFGSAYVMPMYLLDLDRGTTKPLPGPDCRRFSDVAADGTVACFDDSPTGLFKLIRPDRKVLTVPLPSWASQSGGAYFSPRSPQASVAYVAAPMGRTQAIFDGFETDLVNTSTGSSMPLPLAGVLPALTTQSSWLPDGSLVVSRWQGAAGGEPGTYVVSPTGSVVRINATGSPIGLLAAAPP